MGSALFVSASATSTSKNFSATHNLPDTGVRSVRSLVDTLVLGHLVLGVDKTVHIVVSWMH